MRALEKMDEFLGFITQTYFPEFHTFPVLAKMGHLDLAYTAGASGSRNGYKRFAAAVDRRDWKKAGIEQRDGRKGHRIDIVQAWYNRASLQIVDSFLARVLNDTAVMLQMLGAKAVISGMQPAVAITLVEMGCSIIGVETALNLEQGLEKLKRGLRKDRSRK